MSDAEDGTTPRDAEADDDRPGDAEVSQDIVDRTFAVLRKTAGARGRRLPSLAYQRTPTPRAPKNARVPGLEESLPSDRHRRGRARGIPTGADGYIVPRRRDVDSLGTLLRREMKRRGWNGQLASGWIASNWERVVGEKIAQHTTVEMVKNATVFISCDSTAWATNLRYMQTHILKEIGRYVGPDVIAQLRIFGPKAPSWRKGPLHVKGRGPRDTYG